MGDQFRSGDIFCCPSIWEEPFGKVIVEAMACGLPVVATRVGGIPEIARDGGVLLVKPGSATELADALQSLIKDLNKRQAVAEAGLASFHRNFTWHAVLSRYNEIINGLKVPYFRKVA
jgi:glycosyltransferase involved in cell wall biosynthesis